MARNENIGCYSHWSYFTKKDHDKARFMGQQGGSHVGPMNRAILGDKLNGRWVLDIDNQLYPLMTMVKTMMHIIHRQRKKGKIL